MNTDKMGLWILFGQILKGNFIRGSNSHPWRRYSGDLAFKRGLQGVNPLSNLNAL